MNSHFLSRFIAINWHLSPNHFSCELGNDSVTWHLAWSDEIISCAYHGRRVISVNQNTMLVPSSEPDSSVWTSTCYVLPPLSLLTTPGHSPTQAGMLAIYPIQKDSSKVGAIVSSSLCNHILFACLHSLKVTLVLSLLLLCASFCVLLSLR